MDGLCTSFLAKFGKGKDLLGNVILDIVILALCFRHLLNEPSAKMTIF